MLCKFDPKTKYRWNFILIVPGREHETSEKNNIKISLTSYFAK